MRKILATGTLTGAFVIAGVAGATLLGARNASAQDPTATAAPAASGAPAASWAPTAATPAGKGGRGGADFGGDGFGHWAAIAKAIGISETDLQTALASGKTIAAFATEKGVAVQTVIDAYVADENAEIDAAVKAGTLTEAQATTEKANAATRGAEIVNGTGPAGGRGHGGAPDGVAPDGVAPDGTTATPSASPTTIN
jgi:hypothetical protein